MATVTADRDRVRIELDLVERLGALRGDLELTAGQIADVRVEDEPFRTLRGIRAPGIGIPRRVAIGRWRHRRGADLVLLRRGDRAVVVDLDASAPFRRLVIGTDDPAAVAGLLRRVG